MPQKRNEKENTTTQSPISRRSQGLNSRNPRTVANSLTRGFGVSVAARFLNENQRFASQEDDSLMIASAVNNSSFDMNRELLATLIPNNDMGKMMLLASEASLNTDLWSALDSQALNLIKATTEIISQFTHKVAAVSPMLLSFRESDPVLATGTDHIGLSRAAYYLIAAKIAEADPSLSSSDSKVSIIINKILTRLKDVWASSYDSKPNSRFTPYPLTEDVRATITAEARKGLQPENHELQEAWNSFKNSFMRSLSIAIDSYAQTTVSVIQPVKGSPIPGDFWDAKKQFSSPEEGLNSKEYGIAQDIVIPLTELIFSDVELFYSDKALNGSNITDESLRDVLIDSLGAAAGEATTGRVESSSSLRLLLNSVRQYFFGAQNGLGESIMNLSTTYATITQFKSSVTRFTKERYSMFMDSFDDSERLARLFRNLCKNLALARSAGEASTQIEAFEKEILFTSSLAGTLYSIALSNALPDREKMMSMFDLIDNGVLERVLSETFIQKLGVFSPDTTSGISSIPYLSNTKTKFSLTYVPQIILNNNNVIHSIDGEDPVSLNAMVGNYGKNGQSTNNLTPAEIFSVLAMSCASDEDVLMDIAAGRSTAFIMDDIQLPREIKDMVLTRVRAMSIAITYELAQKKRAYDIWAFSKIAAIYDMASFFKCFSDQVDDDFMFMPARDLTSSQVDIVLDACREVAGDLGIPLTSSRTELSLPLIDIYDVSLNVNSRKLNDVQTFEALTGVFSKKQKVNILVEYVKRFKRLLVRKKEGEYVSVRYFNNVVDLNPSLLEKFYMFDGKLEGFQRFKRIDFSDFYSYEVSDEDKQLFLEKVVRRSDYISGTYAYRFNDGVNGIDSILTPGFNNMAGVVSAENTSKAPSFITEAVRTSLQEEIKPVYVDEANAQFRANYIYRTKGDVFLALLAIAKDRLEGFKFGLAPDRIPINMGVGRESILEYMLGAIGLSTASVLTPGDLVPVLALLDANSGPDSPQFPFKLTPKGQAWLKDSEKLKKVPKTATNEYRIALGSLIDLKKEVLNGVKSVGSSWMLHLRQPEFIHLMMSDILSIDSSSSLRFYSINKSHFYQIDAYKGKVTLAIDYDYDINPGTVITHTDVNILSHAIVQTVSDVFRPAIAENGHRHAGDEQTATLSESKDASLGQSLADKDFLEQRISLMREKALKGLDSKSPSKNKEDKKHQHSTTEKKEDDNKEELEND